MDFVQAIVMGWVQGMTEFLPVSSTGHLILVREIFHGASSINDLAFDATLFLATTTALMFYFAKDLTLLVHTLFRILGRLPVDDRDKSLLGAFCVGTLPAIVIGILFQKPLGILFQQPLLVAAVLVCGSCIFAYAEYVYAYKNVHGALSARTGFKIGLFQVLSLMPGMSHSGITISGGLLMGLSRVEAARFTFLLAIPVMLGSGVLKLLELMESDIPTDWLIVAVGAVTAFFVGLGAIHFMMQFVRRYSLWPFIWYRVLLAIFVVALFFWG